MIRLTFNVDDINIVIQVFNQIRVQRATSETGSYTTTSGVGPITLLSGESTYTEDDITGTADHWYRSRYYNTSNGVYSGWSDPILGEAGQVYYIPLYPNEIAYDASDQLVIERIRRLIGDTKTLRRDYGEEMDANIHDDGKSYELSFKGWPVSVIMNNAVFSDFSNPYVSGYKYLVFNDYINQSVIETVVSGCSTTIYTHSVDVWFNSFRHSDREIMEAYDTCPPPAGLTTATANSEHYMLQTAIELLMQEAWEDVIEDGARVADEGTRYDPSPGLRMRDDLLDMLNKRLEDAIKATILSGIDGVLID